MDDSSPIALGDDTIDVWPFKLDGVGDTMLRRWEALLDPAERARAVRFVQPRHQREFVVAHAVMRRVLGRYGVRAPEQLRFATGAHGKPALADLPAPIEFNLTHSGSRAMLAVATTSIGVDLEARRDDLSVMEIAERYFFGDELRTIQAQPREEQSTMFFRFWVAKEAVLKAEGLGLGYPLDSFAVQFARDDRDRASIRSADLSRLSAAWQVRMLGDDPAWPAAIAAQGSTWQVQQRSLQSPNTPRPFP